MDSTSPRFWPPLRCRVSLTLCLDRLGGQVKGGVQTAGHGRSCLWTEQIDLPEVTPGTRRHLVAHRFGHAGARPKAYIQAALHGDELPGILVAYHLRDRLHRLETAGCISGEICLIPVANPIGLSQDIMDHHLGRYDLAEMTNFNRGWPDFTDPLVERVGAMLGADATANTTLIRKVLVELVGGMRADTENAALRCALLSRAIDADLVLDMHCDVEAVTHLYLGTPLWPDAEDLAAEVGACATLLAETSGGSPFDEACSAFWWLLRQRFPNASIPNGCLSATIEYRGMRDVSDEMAAQDAAALERFLIRRGVIAGDPGPLPRLLYEPTPLGGVAMIRASCAGLLSYLVSPGSMVAADDPVARVVDPLAGTVTEVTTPTAGLVYATAAVRLARAGELICKVAGRELLPVYEGQSLLPD
jgi:predicted deacylase